MSRVTSIDQLAAFRQELIDRFGPPPPPVQRLVQIAELRLDAATWQLTALHTEDEYLVFRYSDRARMEQLTRFCGGQLRIVDEASAYLPVGQQVTDPDALLKTAKSVLRPAP